MALAMIFALMMRSAVSDAEHVPSKVVRNYLKGAESRRSCDEQHEAGEVVVCGRPGGDEAYRLRPLEEGAYAERPVRAELDLGDGVSVKAALIQKKLAPGEGDSQPDQPSVRYAKQVRVTLTIPLPAIK